MTSTLQHQSAVSRIRQRGARALALAVVLVPLVLTQSVRAQTYTVLYRFLGTDGQAGPWGPMTLAYGTLYGTLNSGSTVFSFDTHSGVETLFSKLDGQQPYSGVIRDPAGNLYGTTPVGGSFNHGTIFRVDGTGKASVLHSFTIGARTPYGGLIRDANGNLYGTTTGGGTFHEGIVFQLGKKGRYTVLYNFCAKSGCTDGQVPTYENLIMDKAGNLYGTTLAGGIGGQGTVFKLNIKTRIETVLYSFAGGTDGAAPFAGLVQDPSGSLYGTTDSGGGCFGGACYFGTVFKVDTTGKETVLYAFQGYADGARPGESLWNDLNRRYLRLRNRIQAGHEWRQNRAASVQWQ